jgi:hypothetical protein
VDALRQLRRRGRRRVRTVTCEHCHKEFKTETTPEAEMIEAVALYGEAALADGNHAVICDDCFQEFIEWAKGEGLVEVD